MQSLIRSLRVPSLPYITATVKRNSIQPIQQQRNVVFVKSTERVRGLIRDPEDILTLPTGQRYGLTEKNLAPIKEYITSKNIPELPDLLLLQVITHKSFAHGSKPYNAKLSLLGEQLLRFTASKYLLAQSTSNEFAINSLNFDLIGSYVHRMMTTDKMLAVFANSSKGLSDIFFCRLSFNKTSSEDDKINKNKRVFATLPTALIGAIATQHGKAEAERYIESEILPNVLAQIAERAAPQKE